MDGVTQCVINLLDGNTNGSECITTKMNKLSIFSSPLERYLLIHTMISRETFTYLGGE